MIEVESISWGELAELTHATQVERFGWCGCEEGETFTYEDCPREIYTCGDHLLPITDCGCQI